MEYHIPEDSLSPHLPQPYNCPSEARASIELDLASMKSNYKINLFTFAIAIVIDDRPDIAIGPLH
jgi:hypothetical protein